MKKLLVFCLLFSNLVHAGGMDYVDKPTIEHPWYFSLFAGATWLNNNMVPVNVTLDGEGYKPNLLINHKMGYQIGSTIGYRYSDIIRLEGQFSYLQNNTNNALGSVPLTTVAATALFFGNSSLRNLSVMFNGYYDFPHVSQHIEPFIGLGAGFSRVKGSVDGVFGVAPGTPLFSFRESDTVFSYQIMTGFRYNVDDRKFVNFTGRYMGGTRPNFYSNRLMYYAMDLGYTVILDMF